MAKKAAGKPVRVQPLPLSAFVFRNYFPALEPGTPPADKGSNPVRPTFRDIATISKEIEGAVGAVQIPKDLSHPHPIIVRLLQQDEGRKKDQTRTGWMSDYWGPKFVSAIQQRRLRFLTGLFRALERLGCKISGSTHAGEKFTIQVGSSWAYIYCYVESGPARQSGRSYKANTEQIRFDITDHDPERGKTKKSWLEGDTKLEAQASNIVRDFLLSVEQDARSGALRSYDWAVEERARREREAKLAAEKAEAERIARERAAKEAQIKALIDGANSLEEAARIRRYVTAVKNRHEATLPEKVDRRVAWALAKADEVDPLVSNKFLADIDEH